MSYIEDREQKISEALVERNIDWDMIKKIDDVAAAVEGDSNVDDGVRQ